MGKGSPASIGITHACRASGRKARTATAGWPLKARGWIPKIREGSECSATVIASTSSLEAVPMFGLCFLLEAREPFFFTLAFNAHPRSTRSRDVEPFWLQKLPPVSLLGLWSYGSNSNADFPPDPHILHSVL